MTKRDRQFAAYVAEAAGSKSQLVDVVLGRSIGAAIRVCNEGKVSTSIPALAGVVDHETSKLLARVYGDLQRQYTPLADIVRWLLASGTVLYISPGFCPSVHVPDIANSYRGQNG